MAFAGAGAPSSPFAGAAAPAPALRRSARSTIYTGTFVENMAESGDEDEALPSRVHFKQLPQSAVVPQVRLRLRAARSARLARTRARPRARAHARNYS